jgi:hypothetical protein
MLPLPEVASLSFVAAAGQILVAIRAPAVEVTSKHLRLLNYLEASGASECSNLNPSAR